MHIFLIPSCGFFSVLPVLHLWVLCPIVELALELAVFVRDTLAVIDHALG